MVSDWETAGGAAIAASRLADGLAALGHEVLRIVRKCDGKQHGWRTSTSGYPELSVRLRLMSRLSQYHREHAVAAAAEEQLAAIITEFHPDIINLHNLHGGTDAGWSWRMAEACAQTCPTVWTLHDMWSFTGRCVYAYGCRQFMTGCGGNCPSAGEYPSLDPSRIAAAWESRRDVFQKASSLVGVSPSDWLKGEAKAGLWKNHRVETIRNGLPLDKYCPLSQQAARRELGIHQPGPVILAVAQNWDDRRKGGCYLEKMIEQTAIRPLTLVLLGGGAPPKAGAGVAVHPLGFIDDERTKALAYSAADLLLHPAPVDNLPNVVMEAIACGTPVVAFPTGGVVEMVFPGRTGWLASNVSAGALKEATETAISQINKGLSLREACRQFALGEYGQDLQARRYVALFSDMSQEKDNQHARRCA